ncbi:uncharacterized protein LOC111012800 isoform X2 [Momordica charantia]|uniref:Uncharacterized protein LOC111012800 isoform X2 n=1 Tax=Momordica charantia TaxID=3673 RepID=A0A6J1CLU8_MOMCH|nr:uncharacterized protein LOC111012800 isoform X2 [Momordica charantia]
MAPMKFNDHWAFLEEFEAPMWVDLTLEGKSNNHNIDDKWFYTHHPIHQCSYHDLKSASSQLLGEGKNLDFELSVSSSPNIPDSVSRSRGNDFDDKKWKGSCRDFTIDKHMVTSQPLGNSSTLLSDMRRSLRKSYATRQASRLEVNNNSRRQSSGRNSSSSNSSVCSSLNPGFGAKIINSMSEQDPKKARGLGSFSRMTHAAMNKSKVSSVSSSTLMIQVEDVSSNSRRFGKVYNAKSAHMEASKPKILRSKSSLLQKRDEQNACLRPKKKGVLAGRCKIAVAGKENAIGGRIAVSQKGDGRVPSTVSMVKDQKRTQHKVPQRIGGRSVVSLKQAKNCHPSEGKNLENGSQRVYFR